MKGKNIAWLISVIVGVVALAAGVAVLIDRLIKKKENCYEGYIESDCTPEELAEETAEQ